MRGSSVSRSFSAARITAEARVFSSRDLCLLLPRKLICPSRAASSEATCATRVWASAAARPPSCAAICASVSGPRIALFRRRLALERPDHPLGDVDARAAVHGILQDEVELLLLGDLVDDAVGLLDHLRELLVAPLVEVLAELALLALEIAVQVAELAL